MDKIAPLNFTLNNLTLAALACGDENLPPVLCLHGYLDNAASFLPLMQQSKLCENQRIIALDWPGHGHSDHRSADAHYHFLDYVSDLVSLFALNDWPAIDIVAHSMGAMVASAFAAAFPEKVKSLTLIDSLGFITAPAEQATKQLRDGLLSRQKGANNQRSFTEATAVKARLQVCDLQESHAKLIINRSIINQASNKQGLDNKLQYCWRSDPRLRTISPYRLTMAQGQQLLSDIKCPLQLFYGDKGMSLVTKALATLSASLPQLKVIKVSGGHHVHMEQPEKLSLSLESFYRDNKIKTSV